MLDLFEQNVGTKRKYLRKLRSDETFSSTAKNMFTTRCCQVPTDNRTISHPIHCLFEYDPGEGKSRNTKKIDNAKKKNTRTKTVQTTLELNKTMVFNFLGEKEKYQFFGVGGKLHGQRCILFISLLVSSFALYHYINLSRVIVTILNYISQHCGGMHDKQGTSLSDTRRYGGGNHCNLCATGVYSWEYAPFGVGPQGGYHRGCALIGSGYIAVLFHRGGGASLGRV